MISRRVKNCLSYIYVLCTYNYSPAQFPFCPFCKLFIWIPFRLRWRTFSTYTSMACFPGASSIPCTIQNFRRKRRRCFAYSIMPRTLTSSTKRRCGHAFTWTKCSLVRPCTPRLCSARIPNSFSCRLLMKCTRTDSSTPKYSRRRTMQSSSVNLVSFKQICLFLLIGNREFSLQTERSVCNFQKVQKVTVLYCEYYFQYNSIVTLNLWYCKVCMLQWFSRFFSLLSII